LQIADVAHSAARFIAACGTASSVTASGTRLHGCLGQSPRAGYGPPTLLCCSFRES
jgi:hypothetical protein